MLQLFDLVLATYEPPEREQDPRYAQAIGRRTLFQVAGVMTLKEARNGELALMPRDLRDGVARVLPHRVPLGHVIELERASCPTLALARRDLGE